MSEILLNEFKSLEKKIDENLTVRQEIRDKLNELCIDMRIIKKDYYGEKNVDGTHAMTYKHQGYFAKLSGAFLLLTTALTWMKIQK